MISVQTHDFHLQSEYQKLLQENTTGAVVIFCGLVRDFSSVSKSFELQHYPGMTEKVLGKIEAQARRRWQILDCNIIHRVGKLAIDEQIVFVGVSAAHRKHAFMACEFIIDILKTQAPFWKKEGEHWVDAKDDDEAAALAWLEN